MSVQKWNHKSKKVLVTGVSGTGKTTLFWRLVSTTPATWKFVYDHEGEFSSRFGLPRCTNTVDLAIQTEKGGWVCFDPVELYPGEAEKGFFFFCDYVMAISSQFKGRKLFIVDELQKVTGTTQKPEEFLKLCETGRRREVDIFAISNAPNRIHNSVRNAVTEVYSFRLTDKNALAFLADNGFDADSVRNLPNGEYLWRNFNTGESRRAGKAF